MRSLRRRFRRLRLRPLGCSILLGLVLAEIILRIMTRSIPTYREVIQNSLDHPERLYPPYATLSYDVRDLYANGGQVTMRISANRFIEPEPRGQYAYHVLFLGGSTTEAMYVPETQRWVALLNQPGTLAAYNAGQSGANTLDKYYTFRYLTDLGYKFDLVVLSTSINDYTWQDRLSKHGYKLRLDTYREAQRATYTAEYFSDPWGVIRDNVRLLSMVDRVIANLKGKARVLDAYVQDTTSALQGRHLVSLDRCAAYPASLEEYTAAARDNIKRVAHAVRATGAKLLVMDEADSFGAPASSYPVDIRQGPFCGPDTILDDPGSYQLFKQLNQAYLQAGREAGALTFDLDGAMDSLANGPDAATYLYDSIHYTPTGCAKVAEILRPVIDSALAQTI